MRINSSVALLWFETLILCHLHTLNNLKLYSLYLLDHISHQGILESHQHFESMESVSPESSLTEHLTHVYHALIILIFD